MRNCSVQHGALDRLGFNGVERVGFGQHGGFSVREGSGDANGSNWLPERRAALEIASPADRLDVKGAPVVAVVPMTCTPSAINTHQRRGFGQRASLNRLSDCSASEPRSSIEQRMAGSAPLCHVMPGGIASSTFHTVGFGFAHRSGLGNGWSAFAPQQFRPDQMPCLLAHVPAANLPSGRLLDSGRLCRPHLATAGQTLVEVGIAHPSHCGESASVRRGDQWSHFSDHSEWLQINQAIGYNKVSSNLLENITMETSVQRRFRKLKSLVDGGERIADIAKKADVNAQAIDQILKGTLLPKKADGTRSTRSLGDTTARAIEKAYGLGVGWFDAPDAKPPLINQAHTLDHPTQSPIPTGARRLRNIRVVWVVGQGQGGMPESIWGDGDYPVGATDEYTDLATVDEQAFAIRVVGNSMFPRYMPGEYALVEPGTEPEIEDDVLVRLATGETLVKRLLGRRGGIRLGSFNDSEVMNFQPNEISWIYYIAHPIPARRIKQRVDQEDHGPHVYDTEASAPGDTFAGGMSGLGDLDELEKKDRRRSRS